MYRRIDEVSNHARSGGQFLRGLIGKAVGSRATANSRRSRIIQIAQLPTVLALILCIVGGVDQADSSPSEIVTGKKYTKAGVILFLVIYLLLLALAIITAKDVGNGPDSERRVYFAVLVALPFLGERVLWSLLSAFSTNPSFSTTNGNHWVQFGMATLEEFVVVALYTVVGLLL